MWRLLKPFFTDLPTALATLWVGLLTIQLCLMAVGRNLSIGIGPIEIVAGAALVLWWWRKSAA
jgi:hypothetical protein